MKQIAIISDTHGLLREFVIKEIVAADCFIHAGDINTPYLLETLQQLGETYVVRGNNDKDWAEDLPKSITVTIEGVSFFIVHNKKDIPSVLTDVDVVVYGHSHKYSAEIMNGVLFLNPGSCGKRRFDLDITMCRMTVDAGYYQYEKVTIPQEISK
ncbi:metallophosphoesterase family protein [Anaerocolumna sp. AGMB13020]|uniref:metallophosphoesterase family protein n=1 Tax=Anaerocolumna sp. AGMB13020 TaxID=3081750 RepID=UPI002952D927|nr:metallophosphoesterase family protein [Anaerocolumna sp. AGMB13020]WOO37607.1 metallophosphoesterase family protein [Anaerocolumna sp. AGMB13020]